MWRTRLPQRNPDKLAAVALAVAVPAIACILNGVGVIETLITAALIGGVIAVVH